METVYDIRQYLKTFGTYVYTRDRIGDLHIMEGELNDLYQSGMLELRDFQVAKHVLRSEELRLKIEKNKA